MKRSIIAGVAVIGAMLVTILSGGSNAAAQEGKLTREQFHSVELAWNNLKQATNDLVVASPDVKGDTSKLEGHLKAAVNDLHLIDPGNLPVMRWTPGYDKGRARDAIFNAVQGHLDAAKKAIDGSGVKGENIDHAQAEIQMAFEELNTDRNTAVAPAAKTAAKPK
jgi:hypothetical protein